jgi:hypothetical protein
MDPWHGRHKKAASKNDAKQMLILIITFFQVTLWDGSWVEGTAGNKKAAKQNAANRKLKAHSKYYLWMKVQPATKWRPNELLPNIFKNQSCAPLLYGGWIPGLASNKNDAKRC